MEPNRTDSSVCAWTSSSILITNQDGQRVAKYTDLGLAIEVSDTKKPRTHGEAGTPGYMSPELESGKPYSSKTDVWSLAISYVQVRTP